MEDSLRLEVIEKTIEIFKKECYFICIALDWALLRLELNDDERIKRTGVTTAYVNDVFPELAKHRPIHIAHDGEPWFGLDDDRTGPKGYFWMQRLEILEKVREEIKEKVK